MSISKNIYILFLICFSIYSHSSQCLKLGLSVDSKGEKALEKKVQAMYKKAGVCFKIVYLPSKRAEISFLNQEIDALGWRNSNQMERKEYKNIAVALRKPIFSVKTYLISRGGPLELGSKPLCSISYQRGYSPGMKITKEMGCKGIAAGTDRTALKLLRSNRVDAALIPSPSLSRFIFDDEIPKKYNLVVLEGVEMSHYLLKKHKKEILKLNNISSVDNELKK